MAAKLKSILKQIHWSLAVRSLIFGLAWLLFPFWLFFLTALCLYFGALFQAGKLAVPFFILLLLSFSQQPNIFFALIFSAIFYYILLVKDLLIINRRPAYALIVIVLSFFLVRNFYITFANGLEGYSLVYALLTALVFALLVRSFVHCFWGQSLDNKDEVQASTVKPGMVRAAVWLSFFILWQFLILGLFLPLDFIYQSIITFLASILIIDFIPEYCFGETSRSKLLIGSTVIFTLLVLIMSSARWGI